MLSVWYCWQVINKTASHSASAVFTVEFENLLTNVFMAYLGMHYCLQCFDTVGWASGRAPACKKWVMRCWYGYQSREPRVPAIHLLISALYVCVHVAYSYYLFLLTFPICIFFFFFLCVLPSLLSLTFQNMDPLCFQAGGRSRRPNLGLVCFVLMFDVFLVKDACLFSSCWFSFSLVMR